MYKIIFISMDNCPPCEKIKKYLDNKNIDYITLNICNSEDDINVERYLKMVNACSMPVLIFIENEKVTHCFSGYINTKAVDLLLEQIKNNL